MINKKELRIIEKSLSDINLDDSSSIDKLLCMSLYQGVFIGDYISNSFIDILKVQIKLFFIRNKIISPLRHKNFPKNNINDTYLISIISSKREHLIDISTKIMKILSDKGKHVTVIIYDNKIKTNSIIKTLLSQDNIIVVEASEIYSQHNNSWVSDYKNVIISTNKTIINQFERFGLNDKYLLNCLELDTMIQIFSYV